MTALPPDILDEDFLRLEAEHATAEDRARYGPLLKQMAEKNARLATVEERVKAGAPIDIKDVTVLLHRRSVDATRSMLRAGNLPNPLPRRTKNTLWDPAEIM